MRDSFDPSAGVGTGDGDAELKGGCAARYIAASSIIHRRCLLNPSVGRISEPDGSLSQRDRQDVLFYLRMRRAVVSRLTTRRNVYDVFNRAPRGAAVPPVGHPSAVSGLSAGLPISLTITAPICSSATFGVRRASFVAAHKLYHQSARLATPAVVLLNYRHGPTGNRSGGTAAKARRRCDCWSNPATSCIDAVRCCL